MPLLPPRSSVLTALLLAATGIAAAQQFPVPQPVTIYRPDAQAIAASVEPPAAILGTPLPPLAQAALGGSVPPAVQVPHASDTRVMPAPTAPPQPLWLQVLSPGTNSSVDIGEVVVRGRTAPDAEVRVQVDAVPPAPPGKTVVAQPVMLQTVRADALGEFSFTIGAHRAPPGMRYDVLLRASDGSRSTPEQRLVLIHRG